MNNICTSEFWYQLKYLRVPILICLTCTIFDITNQFFLAFYYSMWRRIIFPWSYTKSSLLLMIVYSQRFNKSLSYFRSLCLLGFLNKFVVATIIPKNISNKNGFLNIKVTLCELQWPLRSYLIKCNICVFIMLAFKIGL